MIVNNVVNLVAIFIFNYRRIQSDIYWTEDRKKNSCNWIKTKSSSIISVSFNRQRHFLQIDSIFENRNHSPSARILFYGKRFRTNNLHLFFLRKPIQLNVESNHKRNEKRIRTKQSCFIQLFWLKITSKFYSNLFCNSLVYFLFFLLLFFFCLSFSPSTFRVLLHRWFVHVCVGLFSFWKSDDCWKSF